MASKLVIGFETNCVADLNKLLIDAFATDAQTHPRFIRDGRGLSDTRTSPLTRSDLILDCRQWGSLVVGKIAEWIDLDSKFFGTRLASEKVFTEEMAWVTHLSLAAVLMPELRAGSCANFSRCLNQVIQEANCAQLWVRVPTAYHDEKVEDPWETWSRVRTMCGHAGCLFVALDLTADLPSDAYLARWEGEQIRAVLIRTDIFLTNRKGYPTLSRRHQAFLNTLMKFKVQFVLRGRPQHEKGYLPYLQYLEFLKGKRSPVSENESFEAPYLDLIQNPLQPLMDNLESQTYEVFERDPVKYSRYELAITAALGDTSPEKETLIMVVGAGRGPLIRASLNAAHISNRKVRIVALEKNMNAIITLRNLAITEQWNNVTIVASDMRKWTTTEKADILVSELLGSWGDNELSPECLDGAESFLNENGISIPYEYTSYVAPISSHKLWHTVKSLGELKHMETSYVVKMHNYCPISAEQPCFTFYHPKKSTPSSNHTDNRRFAELRFKVEEACTLHGFAGYFSAKLYKDIDISIAPSSFSEGMFSWFPLFIPIREPMNLSAGADIESYFWRCVSDKKVWYEWTISAPIPIPIHNPNGRSYWIGL